MQLGKGNSLFSWLLKILPSFIIWKLEHLEGTKQKNFDNLDMRRTDIIEAIKSQVSCIFNAHKPMLSNGNIFFRLLGFFNLSEAEKIVNIQLALWKSPSLHWVNLNVDGASKGNPDEAWAGVLIHGSKCNHILAYASFLRLIPRLLLKLKPMLYS